MYGEYQSGQSVMLSGLVFSALFLRYNLITEGLRLD
jgi:hypothetical protein